MSRHPAALLQWEKEVSTHLSQLSKTQIRVLALYSFATVVIGSCGLSSIVYFLSEYLGQKESNLRQRLREITYERQAKRGQQRRSLEVSQCFKPLVKWIIAWWEPTEKRIVLVMDATTLGQRFTVLSVSVVYRGCAIPVAWAVLKATEKAAWNPHWKRLLRCLKGAIPKHWTVLVLTDRGLYAKSLYQTICKNGWHPMMRINPLGKFRPVNQVSFRPLRSLVPQPRTIWYGEVECFVTVKARLRCTLLVHWDADFRDPWLLLTDLPPETADACWYGMRSWIEQGFKDCKRGGLAWEQTKMTQPARAARLWLVIALATLWMVNVGSSADSALPPSSLPHWSPMPPMTQPRSLSCFRRGFIKTLATLLRSPTLTFATFSPEPWPTSPFNRSTLLLLCRGGYAVHY